MGAQLGGGGGGQPAPNTTNENQKQFSRLPAMTTCGMKPRSESGRIEGKSLPQKCKCLLLSRICVAHGGKRVGGHVSCSEMILRDFHLLRLCLGGFCYQLELELNSGLASHHSSQYWRDRGWWVKMLDLGTRQPGEMVD